MVGSGAVPDRQLELSGLAAGLAPGAGGPHPLTAMPASTSGTGWPTVSPPTPDLRLPDALPDDAQSPEVAADLVRRLLGVGPGLTPQVMTSLLGFLSGYGPSAKGPSPCD